MLQEAFSGMRKNGLCSDKTFMEATEAELKVVAGQGPLGKLLHRKGLHSTVMGQRSKSTRDLLGRSNAMRVLLFCVGETRGLAKTLSKVSLNRWRREMTTLTHQHSKV